MGFNITLVGPSWSKGQPFLVIFVPLFFQVTWAKCRHRM